jgi:4-diphosphocytidyl-2-C-methyl-D-erythritol kinase
MSVRYVDQLILSRMRESIRIRCPAKVNLFLRVLGKREDGYHEVENVMQTVTLFDELRIRKQTVGVKLTCSDSELGEHPEDNLAFQAAELFLDSGYGSNGVHLELWKKIPIAAGLGGGSSDGACCLLALNELFGSDLSAETLRCLAAKLGSDAPFFIEGGTALCTGRGEIIQPLRGSPRFTAILVTPDRHLRASEVYESLGPSDFAGPEADVMLRAMEEGNLERVCSALFNGLEGAVLRKAPELAPLKRSLEEGGSMGTVVSGSGPTIVGIFAYKENAEVALGRLRASPPPEIGHPALVTTF